MGPKGALDDKKAGWNGQSWVQFVRLTGQIRDRAKRDHQVPNCGKTSHPRALTDAVRTSADLGDGAGHKLLGDGCCLVNQALGTRQLRSPSAKKSTQTQVPLLGGRVVRSWKLPWVSKNVEIRNAPSDLKGVRVNWRQLGLLNSLIILSKRGGRSKGQQQVVLELASCGLQIRPRQMISSPNKTTRTRRRNNGLTQIGRNWRGWKRECTSQNLRSVRCALHPTRWRANRQTSGSGSRWRHATPPILLWLCQNLGGLATKNLQNL
mmetsp:Transcript_46551/g.95233  ORF Transcript_46551/g.95233 Transcript_46551/m.95233 type:complete len:264 (-) Transcript_46551:275-1066(-)